jgi:hypothetical protein
MKLRCAARSARQGYLDRLGVNSAALGDILGEGWVDRRALRFRTPPALEV